MTMTLYLDRPGRCLGRADGRAFDPEGRRAGTASDCKIACVAGRGSGPDPMCK